MTIDLAACRPARAPGLAARHLAGTHTIEDATSGQSFVVNDTALAVWDLCDGATSAAEMVDAMTSIFNAPPQVVERDVLSVLDHLASLGLLRGIPGGDR